MLKPQQLIHNYTLHNLSSLVINSDSLKIRIMELTIQSILPDKTISHFVHSFWMLQNTSGKDITTTLLPNGMVDLVVIKTNSGKWNTVIRGIDTQHQKVTISTNTIMFSIGLKLLAVEYLLGNSIKDVLNEGKIISDKIWPFTDSDLSSLALFAHKATQIINSLTPSTIDSRKLSLFQHLYTSNGSIAVKQLSDKVFWSSRQINRYFNQQFGISLKSYCQILRFGASFKPISQGNFYPDQNYTDQNHFIKAIKKYSGVTPRELGKNKQDQFIDIMAVKNLPS